MNGGNNNNVDDGVRILVPINGEEDEAVEIRLDNLPDDPEDQCAILMAEAAPLRLWLKFAMAYYQQGRYEQFLNILTRTQSADADAAYTDEPMEDKLNIITALGTYYTEMEAIETDPQTKRQYFESGLQIFNKGTDLEAKAAVLWAGKGLLNLQRDEVAQADGVFNVSLFYDQRCVPAILGKACCLYRMSNYRESLEMYQLALRLAPNTNPLKRLGIGLCYMQLKMYDLATVAFERVLEFDPDNVEALCCLVVLRANEGGQMDTKTMEHALRLLEHAFQIAPNDANVLNLLANFFFYRREYEKVRQVAERIQSLNPCPALQVEAAFHSARTWHVEGDYERAFNTYTQALKGNGEHLLSVFGLGQILVKRGKHTEAIEQFEKVLKHRSDNLPLYRILSHLYLTTRQMTKARDLLVRGTNAFPESIELWVERGNVLKAFNPLDAYNAYMQAVSLARTKKIHIPPQLWNNIGCMCHQLNKIKEAIRAFTRSLGSKTCTVLRVAGLIEPTDQQQQQQQLQEDDDEANGGDNDDDGGHIPLRHLTVAYNLALVLETDGQLGKAERLLNAIITDHPQYVSAYLRMGEIEMKAGQYDDAERWLEQGLKRADELGNAAVRCNALSHLGNFMHERGRLDQAITMFKNVLAVNKHDGYALVALGSIELERAWSQKDARRTEAKVKEASMHFRRALEYDERNMYAAHGVASCLDQLGAKAEARRYYSEVKEASADMPDVWLNIAAGNIADGRFDEAVKLYQHVLQKFADRNEPLYQLLLARAYYLQDDMLNAKAMLTKLLHKHPHDEVLWFDLGLTLEEYGVRILQRNIHERTYNEVLHAVRDLQSAVWIFKRLMAVTEPVKSVIADTVIVPKKAAKHMEFCNECLQDSQSHLEYAKTQEEYALRVRETSKQVHEQEERRRLEEEAAKAEALRLEEENKEMRAREDRERLEQLQQAWNEQAQAVAEQAASKKKRKKDRGEEAEYNPAPSMFDASTVAQVEADAGDERKTAAEEEEDEARAKDDALAELSRKRRAATSAVAADDGDGDGGDGGGDEEEEEQVLSAPSRKRARTSALFGDDEEEEEEKNGGGGGDGDDDAGPVDANDEDNNNGDVEMKE